MIHWLTINNNPSNPIPNPSILYVFNAPVSGIFSNTIDIHETTPIESLWNHPKSPLNIHNLGHFASSQPIIDLPVPSTEDSKRLRSPTTRPSAPANALRSGKWRWNCYGRRKEGSWEMWSATWMQWWETRWKGRTCCWCNCWYLLIY